MDHSLCFTCLRAQCTGLRNIATHAPEMLHSLVDAYNGPPLSAAFCCHFYIRFTIATLLNVCPSYMCTCTLRVISICVLNHKPQSSSVRTCSVLICWFKRKLCFVLTVQLDELIALVMQYASSASAHTFDMHMYPVVSTSKICWLLPK